MNRLLKKPFFGRYRVQWRWPEAYPHKQEWSPLVFPSGSGAKIAALYGVASGAAKGSIVCAHPMGISAKGYYLKHGHADFLRQQGYNVLLFDFNGFGESTQGDFKFFYDVLGAGQIMKSLAPQLPLGYLGISFGGAWGLSAFAQFDHPYDAAMIEGSFTTLEEYWRREPPAYYALKLLGLTMPMIKARLQPIRQVSQLRKLKALMFIGGELDDITPPEMAQQLHQASNIPSELWLVPEAKHAMAFAAHPAAYQGKMLEFFSKL